MDMIVIGNSAKTAFGIRSWTVSRSVALSMQSRAGFAEEKRPFNTITRIGCSVELYQRAFQMSEVMNFGLAEQEVALSKWFVAIFGCPSRQFAESGNLVDIFIPTSPPAVISVFPSPRASVPIVSLLHECLVKACRWKIRAEVAANAT